MNGEGKGNNMSLRRMRMRCMGVDGSGELTASLGEALQHSPMYRIHLPPDSYPPLHDE